MHDCFELVDRVRISDELLGELRAIDPAVHGDARKCRLDRTNGLPFVKVMHHRIGIVHRHASLAKKLRGSRLAHTDRASEAEDEHQAPDFARMSSSKIFRCSAVTFGFTPNQCEKPFTA